jgi:P pilus assembly chaperone PapD
VSRAARTWLALVALVASLVALPAQSQAAASPQLLPSLSVSPAIVETSGAPPLALPNTTLHNSTTRSVVVHVYPVFVSQAIDGGLVPSLGRKRQARAGKLLRVSPSSFRLGPGASITLHERWLRRAAGKKGTWAAIAVDALPAVAHPRYRLRLLQALLLTTGKAAGTAAKITGVDDAAASSTTTGFSIRVHNAGNIHAWIATAGLQLRTLGGRAVGTLHAVLPHVVLPRSTRDVPLAGAPRLRPGRYRATGTIQVGTRVLHRTFVVTVKKTRAR